MESLGLLQSKNKVVFVLGTTGSGKSKLAIALAKRFNGEVVNSDKMQVYDGLDVITNKVTAEECNGVPHHLLGGVHPDADFTVDDFRREATRTVESILAHGRLPVVAGGSNRYVQALVEGEGGEFRARFDCCFVWLDVSLDVLREFVEVRVDKMVERGLVEEARSMFRPNVDYTTGIRRSIGVPEMDTYFQLEDKVDETTRKMLLEASIMQIKNNTFILTCRQLEKIRRFCKMGWDVQRIDSTEFFLRRGACDDEEELWEKVVGEKGVRIMEEFLGHEKLAKVEG